MIGWGNIWERLIGNKRSPIIEKENSKETARKGEEEFMTRAEHSLENCGKDVAVAEGSVWEETSFTIWGRLAV